MLLYFCVVSLGLNSMDCFVPVPDIFRVATARLISLVFGTGAASVSSWVTSMKPMLLTKYVYALDPEEIKTVDDIRSVRFS